MERLRLKPYDDRTGKTITSWTKKATIGYGHLIAKAHWELYSKGITLAQANSLLSSDLQRFEAAVNSLNADLTQQQYDAAVALSFNIGLGPKGFSGSSAAKLMQNPNAVTDYSNLESAWKAWNLEGGEESKGLVNRRNAEWGIYSSGTYSLW